MSDKTAYRTTAKGAAEVAANPGKLKPGLKGLLAAVGEKASAESLRIKFPRAGDIAAGLMQLALDGYITPLPDEPAKPTAKSKAAANSLETCSMSGRRNPPSSS